MPRIPSPRPPDGHWSPFGTVEAEVLIRRGGEDSIVEVFEDLMDSERSLAAVEDLVTERARVHGQPLHLLSRNIRWAGPESQR